MKKWTLDGAWELKQLMDIPAEGQCPQLTPEGWITGQVPGEVHQDLICAGKMENIFASREAAGKGAWVCDADWVYRRSFDVPEDILREPNLFLHFDSIDTFADVFVNGVWVGSTKNAFIRENFPLKNAGLKETGNTLVVHLKGHKRMTADLAKLALETCAVDSESGREAAASRNVTRRPQRTYSADIMGFGFYVLGIGIPKSVWLEAHPSVVIEDTIFRVLRADEEQAVLYMEAKLNGAKDGQTVAFTLTREGNANQWTFPVWQGTARGTVVIHKPALWWPNGYGKQNLYQWAVMVLDGETLLEERTARVGIRQVEIIRVKENGRATFQFRVNGKEIYIFGGNMMAIHFLTATGTPEESRRILKMAVQANLNMFRLWAGGNNEADWFYDLCDEMGIMIWKDSYLHFMPYPDNDPDFVDNVTRETREMLRYMRNHACFAVYCGANEMHEGYQAYNYRAMMDRFYGSKLLYDVFPALAKEMCPEVPFVPDSPHGEDLAQSPVDGDTHTWGNFFNATKDPLFSTETCWYDGSHPRPQTIEKVMGLKMSDYEAPGWHKKWFELTGRELQGNHKYGEYYWLDSLADYMRSLEIEQMLADYQGMYYLRCRSSSCNGILYWSFNKGGMFIGFGCIDCDQRPLMAYYQLARVFEPVVCHLYRDIDDIRLVAANSTFAGVHATVRVTHMNVEGQTLGQWEKDAYIPRGNAIRLMNLDNYYQAIADRKRELIHVDVFADGKRISQDTLFFCMWPEFKNPEADLDIRWEKAGEGWTLAITSRDMVKMLSIESNGNMLWSDNYFTMMPGETRRITGELLAPWEKPLKVTVSALDCRQTYEYMLE